jgi:membrane-associated phospholipid phosphatase
MPTSAGSSRTTLLGAGTVGVVAVVLLGVAIHSSGNGPLVIDSWWHDLMLAWRTGLGLALAHALDLIGGVMSMIIVGIAIVCGFLLDRRPWSALTVVVSMLACEAITGVLKVSIARPRPADSLANDAVTSFPSGHTSLAATTAIVLALLIRSRIAWILAAIWVAAMAWSRTYLEAHWLSDVVAGAVLGASVAMLVWALVSPSERETRLSAVPSPYGSPGG